MKLSNLWLRVAEFAHDEAVRPAGRWPRGGLCIGVGECAPDPITDWKMCDQLKEVYGRDVPVKKYWSANGFWWGLPGSNERNDNARVLAALFLREMALDDEGRK